MINSLYLQWKGVQKITKPWQKITKVFFTEWKINEKKKFALHLRAYIPIPLYWSGVSCNYDIIVEFKLSCKIFDIYDIYQKISLIYLRSYYLALRLFICPRSIYSLIIFKEMKFWDVALQASLIFENHVFKYFFSRFYTK